MLAPMPPAVAARSWTPPVAYVIRAFVSGAVGATAEATGACMVVTRAQMAMGAVRFLTKRLNNKAGARLVFRLANSPTPWPTQVK